MKKVWRKVGKVDDFQVGTTTEVRFEDPSPLPWAGMVGMTAAWLQKRSETEFVAFSVNCQHLGCPVRWEAGARLFMCPCHGKIEGFSIPLKLYPVKVKDLGHHKGGNGQGIPLPSGPK